MQDNRDLDALVDEALSSYTAAEPDPSLRVHIMAHAAEASPGQKRLWLFAPAAACAATLVIVFLLHPSAPAPHPERSTATSTASAPASPAPVRAALPPMSHPHPALAAHRMNRRQRPKMMGSASFPSPTPLTAQETILLKFAMEHPDQVRQILAAPTSQPIENASLAIASIHIAALSETQQTQ
jgi:hypothetical protein